MSKARQKLLVRALALLAALVATALASPARADDFVMLKNGGRVFGLVVEEDPTKGVRIKLPDGTLREIPKDEVLEIRYGDAASAPPPAAPPPAPAPPGAAVPQASLPPAPPPAPTGSLRVESTHAGRVSIDGGERGDVGPDMPFELSTLAVGNHKVRLDFSIGGSQTKTILVDAGQRTSVSFEASNARVLFQHRRGAHLGAAIEATMTVPLGHGHLVYGGGALSVFVNVGLAPALDFRAGVYAPVLFSSGEKGGGDDRYETTYTYLPIAATAWLRMNLGTVYTIGVGAWAGPAVFTYVDENGQVKADTAGFVGPQLTVLSFRFGSERQAEVEFKQAIGWYPALDGEVLQQSVVFSYLFL